MPGPNLPQLVFFPKWARSNEVLMMQHKEHWRSEQKLVQPLSPRVHLLRVPCHRRFSLPGGRLTAVKWPRASTASLNAGNISGCIWTRKGCGNVPICVVLIQDFLSRHDLVDSANLRACCRVPPRTLELLGNYARVVSDAMETQGEDRKQKNPPLLNVSFSSPISMIAGEPCITETSQAVQKLVFPDLSAFLQAMQPLRPSLQRTRLGFILTDTIEPE